MTLEVGDMVLVCVIAFKGDHKIQDRWENGEYVVDKQPYPNVPVYVVCPRDGEGCSQTLLPINSNIEQGKIDKPVAGVGNTTSLTAVSPEDSAPADAGSSWIITPNAAGSTPQGSPDQPAPLRCSTRTTQN